MNTKQLNASALKNSAKEMIERLATKKTIKAVLTDWNVCVMQSGADFLTFDFPVEGWTRKAQVVAELERVMVQLTNIMEGRDALENAPVEAKHETMVQDIKKGMVVVNPVMQSQRETVLAVDDFSCYFIITFSGIMGQQYFDRGETLIVCEAEQATQTINDSGEDDMTLFKDVSLNTLFVFNGVVLKKVLTKPVLIVGNPNATTNYEVMGDCVVSLPVEMIDDNEPVEALHITEQVYNIRRELGMNPLTGAAF